jgi:lipid-binding SYLF domain-containing protein
MKLRSAVAFVAALAVLGFPAFGADKATKQAETDKAVQTALDKFYQKQPALKGEVQKAPGYAVFSSLGMSFLVGGSGGEGIAFDSNSHKKTYMEMAQASAGVQAGIQRRDLLIIFKTPAALAHFVDKGWEFGAGGAVGAGAGSKGNVGGGSGEQFVNDALFYSLTDKGVEVGAGFQGTKFWKDKDLN